jgi:hypothetical protein
MPQTGTNYLKLAERGGETWKRGEHDKSLALLTEARQLASFDRRVVALMS